MSRIGKKPVPVGKAKVTLKDRHVTVEGPKGKLEMDVHPTITITEQDGNLVVTRPDDEKTSKALHGLTRALLANTPPPNRTPTRPRRARAPRKKGGS